MANRNELHIHQSGDPMGVSYSIYRASTPDVAGAGALVAVVNEANAVHTAYKQMSEELIQDTSDPFIWYTSKVYEETPNFTLYTDGSVISMLDITSYPNSKKFRISDRYDLTNTIITADYWYLASVVLDDEKPQPGVDYIGPTANALHPPINFEMAYDFNAYAMNVSWDLDATPVPYYYAIKATDRSGYESPLSDVANISLSPRPDTIAYVIEKATNVNGPWFAAAEVNDLFWDDPDAAVGGHVAMQFTGTNQGSHSALLEFINPWYNWTQNWRPSYFYRVHCKDNEKEVGPSAPNIPYYRGINIKPARYILRRKVDNGAPASLDGLDAITIHTWTEADAGAGQTLSFIDSALTAAIYSYTTYVIDEKGMVGQPFYIPVDMR